MGPTNKCGGIPIFGSVCNKCHRVYYGTCKEMWWYPYIWKCLQQVPPCIWDLQRNVMVSLYMEVVATSATVYMGPTKKCGGVPIYGSVCNKCHRVYGTCKEMWWCPYIWKCLQQVPPCIWDLQRNVVVSLYMEVFA